MNNIAQFICKIGVVLGVIMLIQATYSIISDINKKDFKCNVEILCNNEYAVYNAININDNNNYLIISANNNDNAVILTKEGVIELNEIINKWIRGEYSYE